MRNSRFLALFILLSLVAFAAACPKKTPPPTPTPTPTPDIIATMAATPTPEPEPDCSLETVYFDFDKALIRSEFRATLKDVAECLENNPDMRVSVAGHADERGGTEYNLALGEQRANAVRDYLINLGVSPRQMTAVSYGEERPAVQGHDEDSWAKNRRVEFDQ